MGKRSFYSHCFWTALIACDDGAEDHEPTSEVGDGETSVENGTTDLEVAHGTFQDGAPGTSEKFQEYATLVLNAAENGATDAIEVNN